MAAGRPSDYDPSYCELIINLAHEGNSRYEICAELGIAMSTFNLWRTKHPEFSAAVELSDTFYKAWLISQPKRLGFSKDFCDKAWLTLMRHNSRLAALGDAKTYQEQHDAVIKAVSEGEILPDDGSKLINSIGARIKIDEATEFEQRLKNLEQKA